MRPQDLFETFADMELAWGPTWSGSLKSLWLGEGEAIGDIVVGEELAEQLGTEPMMRGRVMAIFMAIALGVSAVAGQWEVPAWFGMLGPAGTSPR